MASPFEVDVDNSGRIQGFIPEGFPDVVIGPEDMAEKMDGGETVTLRDAEYNLLPNGSLVHPSVEVIGSVELGAGVRLDEGTTFHRFHPDIKDPRDKITIGDRARIEGTEIEDHVEIGSYALILAQSIAGHTSIGTYARIGSGTTIGHGVKIGDTAKIDRDSQIGNHVEIERAARLGYNTTVGSSAKIGHHARIGKFTGAGSRGVNQDGVLILSKQVVREKSIVTD
jgi:bifunctional N-acetylglucosamine-1-phosphate-uridyltransferase/glucosamine-1-phosphate-acetyltransferase GlmU-like protein